MTLICVSLMDNTIAELIASAERCRTLDAALIEIRLDHLTQPISASSLQELFQLRERYDIPMIITARPLWEGGKFKEKEERRITILIECIDLGFDYVDIELKMDVGKRDMLIAKARENGVRTIVSYHNFESTPPCEEILKLIEQCVNAKGDIAKVVFNNKSYEDALNVLLASGAARERNYTYSAMGIGPFGHITRILGQPMGSEIVYASLDNNRNVIEGQVDIKTLKHFWETLG